MHPAESLRKPHRCRASAGTTRQKFLRESVSSCWSSALSRRMRWSGGVRFWRSGLGCWRLCSPGLRCDDLGLGTKGKRDSDLGSSGLRCEFWASFRSGCCQSNGTLDGDWLQASSFNFSEVSVSSFFEQIPPHHLSKSVYLNPFTSEPPWLSRNVHAYSLLDLAQLLAYEAPHHHPN